jgi:3-polyprenyl-4-hydroxybenzoate decarboxylase
MAGTATPSPAHLSHRHQRSRNARSRVISRKAAKATIAAGSLSTTRVGIVVLPCRVERTSAAAGQPARSVSFVLWTRKKSNLQD